ncbi:MAG: restriction endonuclease [Acetobacteraceae bacterium]
MRSLARAAAQAERARQRSQNQADAAARRAFRDAARQAAADAKAAAKDYVIAQIEEAETLSREVHARELAIETLLTRALAINPAVDLRMRIKSFVPARFDEHRWPSEPPLKLLPQPLSFFARMIPGATSRYDQQIKSAELRYQKECAEHEEARRRRDAAFVEFQEADRKRAAQLERENVDVRDLQKGLDAGEHAPVLSYFQSVIDGSLKGEPDAISAELGYSSDSKHLVVDLDLPDFCVIPEEIGFKYVKSLDRIDPIPRPVSKRKALYSNLICQIALKCIDAIFRSNPPTTAVSFLTVNGMLDTVNPSTGRNVRVCLLSVGISADGYASLNLAQVQPEHCLRSLKASVSRAPAELVPVRPLLELNMVDPRFVETMEVMSGLDHRTNLMELSPTEFEGLITNLFAAMGLDTRQTQPSRDGGVDCIAFDARPIFGGKVVIQAKRYKNTVGVSAVRDLFGTVQNEGASKGILVTTSGYGKAAFEFAQGKPLELLDGGNLLHLLSEHAGIQARIVMPENWTDQPIHGE